MVVGTRTNKSNNSGSSCTQKAMAASNVNAEKDSEICGTCKNIVKVNEKAMACNICKDWFHTKCEGVRDELYDVLTQNNLTAIHWFCTNCNKVANGIMTNIAKVLKTQEEIKNDIQAVKVDVSKNVQDISNLEGSMASCTENVKQNTDDITSMASDLKQLSTQISDIISEPPEYEKRKMNTIISGLPENTNDNDSSNAQVTHVLNLLEVNCEFENVIRLGQLRADGKPRFVRVTFKTIKDKDSILSKAKTIKDKNPEGLPFVPQQVYISPDLTRLQRLKAYKARVARRAKNSTTGNAGTQSLPNEGQVRQPDATGPARD